MQIKADVTGFPVRSVQGDAATSAGAAMLAGVAAGNFPDLEAAAAATVRLADEPVLPDPATAGVYADAYGRYRRLFDATEQALA
jgi:sugar (pentulose or hexulose) kinase